MIFTRPEVVKQILRMYMTGVAINDIADFLATTPEVVNDVIDSFAFAL